MHGPKCSSFQACLGWASLASIIVAGCGDPAIDCGGGSGPIVRFDAPRGALDSLVAHPWPSDGLLQADDRVRLSHFPNPTGSTTLQDYLQVFATEIRGFSTSAAIYLGFSEPMAPSSFPGDPGVALTSEAGVFLVDIDARSPERGRRFPLQLRYGTAATVYLPAHHLIALPPFGATLRANTTYALLLTSRVMGTSGLPLRRSPRFAASIEAEACSSNGEEALSAYEPLASWLRTQPNAHEVVGGTVFTTRDAVDEIRTLANAVRAVPVPTASNWRALMPSTFARRYEAQIELPAFQSGQRPYATLGDGGGLVRTSDGFAVDHQETARLAVALPQQSAMPPDGWPVVLYSHGTGGNYQSVFDAAVADSLAAQGIASIGYDGTLHGPRDPTGRNPDLTFFNIFNPVAARDNVRQGAADLVALTRALSTMTIPADVAGTTARFDTDRLAFLGHSQGALVGAAYLAADNTPRAAVFSGLGAILTITLLERRDVVNFRSLLSSLLRLPDDEQLDALHPVLNLIQQFIEPADPIAYARSYRDDPAPGVPASILMVEGLRDFASPAQGQEAFSVAAGLPVIQPQARQPEAAVWLGPAAEAAPVSNNVQTPSGPATFGLIQYPDETHFPIFENADANRRYVEFVRTALSEGPAVIAPSQ